MIHLLRPKERTRPEQERAFAAAIFPGAPAKTDIATNSSADLRGDLRALRGSQHYLRR
jgi:hypothetical protein